MRVIFIALLLCSCSPRSDDNNILPRYSDMGAAEDAGKVPSYGK
jgi:hypothetical protein